MPSFVPLLVGAAALALIGCAALQDIRERLIADRFSLLLLALAPLQHAAHASGLAAWLALVAGALAVAAAIFAVGFLLWRLGGLGGGDVKLLVAAGAFVGPDGIVALLAGTVLAGGVLALAELGRAALSPVVATLAGSPSAPAAAGARRTIPYGMAIAAGAACAIVPSLPPLIG